MDEITNDDLNNKLYENDINYDYVQSTEHLWQQANLI
jgi:hypothetical protein